MAKKYTLMNKEAIDELCKAVRESHSISEAIDDEHLATNSTYSSVKISQELNKKADDVNLAKIAKTGSYNDLADVPTSLPANGGNSDTVNNHTVNSDVPANAVFTDTWRCIQDNLTSNSAEDSLSANQGKVLNEKIEEHTDNSDIHVTMRDKENWNSHPTDISALGNPVQIDGLQGGVPFNKVEVSGKNLIQFPYYDGTSKTLNGITYTVNSDGSVTANGTATADSAFYFSRNYKFKGTNTDLFLSGCPNNGSGNTYDIVLVTFDYNNTSVDVYNDVGIGKKLNISGNAQTLSVYIRIRSGQTVENLLFRPQLELGDTATEYEPPITGRDLTVGVSGKNLLQKMVSRTIGGLNYSTNDDGSVNVTGTQTAENYPNITSVGGMLLKSGNYTLSGGTERLQITALDVGTNTIIARSKIAPATISIDTDKYVRIYVYSTGAYNGQTFDDVIYPQLEIGTTPTPYEPYHGAEYTITPDSNPYTVPVDIIQQDGINVLSIADDSHPTISVSANKASEQLGMIFRTLDNKPVLLFDGDVPTFSGAYAEFNMDKEFLALIIVPICNSLGENNIGICTIVPTNYIGTEEKDVSIFGYPNSSVVYSAAYIKRDGNAIYIRESSASCDHMIIYGI